MANTASYLVNIGFPFFFPKRTSTLFDISNVPNKKMKHIFLTPLSLISVKQPSLGQED
jgi:hypothetical protein